MTSAVIRDLGDGLILRRGTAADADALADFNGEIFRHPNAEEPNRGIAGWTRDLASGNHPTFKPGDFTIVEDTRTGQIASSLCLISQTWSYGGIPFGVGRPEIVGTDPRYRKRGLVREQFVEIHRWSAERGELVQAITGIPYFYRQFGYDMALTVDARRWGTKLNVPALKEGESEPYQIRSATAADLPLIAAIEAETAKRYLVNCVRDAKLWQYEMTGRSPSSGMWRQFCVVEAADGEPIGFLAHRADLAWGRAVVLTNYELKRGVSWLAVSPSVYRYLDAIGDAYAREDGKGEHRGIGFSLGAEHPAYLALGDRLPSANRSYAWYIRVPDLPAFLRRIAPVLERRLAESIAVGHSGELKISFYRSGLRLTFERGKLADAESWVPPVDAEETNARFPDLSFLQLLFGYRGLDALESAYADCRANTTEARVLLNALFPTRPSQVWPIA